MLRQRPTRADLLYAALSLMTDVDHAKVTGDPRADLIGQMSGFRAMMHERGISTPLSRAKSTTISASRSSAPMVC